MMKRYVMILLIGFLLGHAASAYAFQKVRIVVCPFQVYSPEDQAYLETEIPKIIMNLLRQEGAETVESGFDDATWIKTIGGIEGIRKIGIQNGADHVIWGSMTRIDQKISIDAKMLSTFAQQPPEAFYEQGESIENLSGILAKIANNFSRKIFKKETIALIRVAGNSRIEIDAILKRIKTAPGNIYLAKSLSEDMKSVYAMGYFDDIRIESEESPKGKIITFVVKEKPTVRNVQVKNNRIYDDEKIQEVLTIKTGSILNIFTIKNNVQRIESLYREKNYHNAKVTYNVVDLDNNQADIEFIIEEGQKIRIQMIHFIGNQAYTEDQLRKVMKTSEENFWSWLTSAGELNREDLNQDMEILTSFYQNHGYIDARVSDPQVDFKETGIEITLKLDEGKQFEVGEVKISGADLIFPEDELINRLKIRKEKHFNREIVRNDVLALTELYQDEGYAYTEIIPDVNKLPTQQVDITYKINKGKPVTFEKIIISGNTKTRDKIIRRELPVYEQELYNGKKLKRGIRNLYRLDYFEEVKVNTEKGSSDDKMILKIDVTEKPTGTISFGGGYSSVENVFFMAAITQRNLFGRGQTLQLKGEIGGQSNRFVLSFTEPYLFDTPLSVGFNVYNWDRDYDTYDRESKGAGVTFGYPVYDYTRVYLSYAYDVGEINNITEDASNLVWDLEGKNVTSSVTTSLRYDSRDKVFNPTEGADHKISLEYAGLGGDIAYTKYLVELGQYIPLFWGTIGFLHGKAGYVDESSRGKLPDYERFYLGGINSLRGFDWRDVCVYDDEGYKIGGNKFIQFNIEYLIPLIEKAGLVGVLFYDTGNVYNKSEEVDFSEFRESVGFGFRWYSPIGPIRIENGYILDPKEGEDSGGRWEFTIGQAF